MSYQLNRNDYKQILEYYDMKIPRTYRLIKIAAEKILSKKLCRCIKKVDTQNEGRSIGICTKSIFNRKGLTRGKFKCKDKSSVKFNKTKKSKR
jgi:hypothetical protein